MLVLTRRLGESIIGQRDMSEGAEDENQFFWCKDFEVHEPCPRAPLVPAKISQKRR